MSDLQTLFQQVDDLTPEEIKQLHDYIVNKHVKFVPTKPTDEPPKKRVLGVHAHLGLHWMSDDFNDELPDEFWFGEE